MPRSGLPAHAHPKGHNPTQAQRAQVATVIDLDAVRPIKTNVNCKICSSPERRQIEHLIYRQRLRDKDENGKTISVQYVLNAMAQLGVVNPNTDNIKTHFKTHCEVISQEEREEEVRRTKPLLDVSTDEIMRMSRAELLDLMMRQGIAEASARLQAAGKSGITVDQVLKIAELQIREKGSEAQNDFLKAIGTGIAGAFNRLPGGEFAPRQLPEGEIVDVGLADVVEEEIAA